MPRPDVTVVYDADMRPYERTVSRALGKTRSVGKLDVKGFTQPLGKITGAASEFQRSLDASHARVLAFGASAGAIYAIKRAFEATISSMVNVEKALVDINTLLGLNTSGLKVFGQNLFKTAINTASSFKDAAEAATEFSRQGLSMEETLARTNAALGIARLSGLGLQESIAGVTAALNSFNKEAITATELTDKLATVDARFAISAGDLTQAIRRVGSTAEDANVSLDEMLAIVTAAQQKTARGGAIIGNAFKTIFTRLQRPRVLNQLESLGIKTKNVTGEVRPLMSILKELASQYDRLAPATRAQTAELIGGVFQVNVLKAALSDLKSDLSNYESALQVSKNATGEFERRNAELNQTLDAKVNQTLAKSIELFGQLGGQTLGGAATGGIDLVDDFLATIDKGINVQEVGNISDEFWAGFWGKALDSASNVIQGPMATLLTVLLGKLAITFVQFGKQSLAAFGGLGKASQHFVSLQKFAVDLLNKQPDLVEAIRNRSVTVEEVQKRILTAYKAQSQELRVIQSLASGTATAGTALGLKAPKGSAIGHFPMGNSFKQEEAAARVLGASRNVRAHISKGTIDGQRFLMNSEETEFPGFGRNGDSMVVPKYSSKGHAEGYIPEGGSSGGMATAIGLGIAAIVMSKMKSSGSKEMNSLGTEINRLGEKIAQLTSVEERTLTGKKTVKEFDVEFDEAGPDGTMTQKMKTVSGVLDEKGALDFAKSQGAENPRIVPTKDVVTGYNSDGSPIRNRIGTRESEETVTHKDMLDKQKNVQAAKKELGLVHREINTQSSEQEVIGEKEKARASEDSEKRKASIDQGQAKKFEDIDKQKTLDLAKVSKDEKLALQRAPGSFDSKKADIKKNLDKRLKTSKDSADIERVELRAREREDKRKLEEEKKAKLSKVKEANAPDIEEAEAKVKEAKKKVTKGKTQKFAKGKDPNDVKAINSARQKSLKAQERALDRLIKADAKAKEQIEKDFDLRSVGIKSKFDTLGKNITADKTARDKTARTVSSAKTKSIPGQIAQKKADIKADAKAKKASIDAGSEIDKASAITGKGGFGEKRAKVDADFAAKSKQIDKDTLDAKKRIKDAYSDDVKFSRKSVNIAKQILDVDKKSLAAAQQAHQSRIQDAKSKAAIAAKSLKEKEEANAKKEAGRAKQQKFAIGASIGLSVVQGLLPEGPLQGMADAASKGAMAMAAIPGPAGMVVGGLLFAKGLFDTYHDTMSDAAVAAKKAAKELEESKKNSSEIEAASNEYLQAISNLQTAYFDSSVSARMLSRMQMKASDALEKLPDAVQAQIAAATTFEAQQKAVNEHRAGAAQTTATKTLKSEFLNAVKEERGDISTGAKSEEEKKKVDSLFKDLVDNTFSGQDSQGRAQMDKLFGIVGQDRVNQSSTAVREARAELQSAYSSGGPHGGGYDSSRIAAAQAKLNAAKEASSRDMSDATINRLQQTGAISGELAGSMGQEDKEKYIADLRKEWQRRQANMAATEAANEQNKDAIEQIRQAEAQVNQLLRDRQGILSSLNAKVEASMKKFVTASTLLQKMDKGKIDTGFAVNKIRGDVAGLGDGAQTIRRRKHAFDQAKLMTDANQKIGSLNKDSLNKFGSGLVDSVLAESSTTLKNKKGQENVSQVGIAAKSAVNNFIQQQLTGKDAAGNALAGGKASTPEELLKRLRAAANAETGTLKGKNADGTDFSALQNKALRQEVLKGATGGKMEKLLEDGKSSNDSAIKGVQAELKIQTDRLAAINKAQDRQIEAQRNARLFGNLPQNKAEEKELERKYAKDLKRAGKGDKFAANRALKMSSELFGDTLNEKSVRGLKTTAYKGERDRIGRLVNVAEQGGLTGVSKTFDQKRINQVAKDKVNQTLKTEKDVKFDKLLADAMKGISTSGQTNTELIAANKSLGTEVKNLEKTLKDTMEEGFKFSEEDLKKLTASNQSLDTESSTSEISKLKALKDKLTIENTKNRAELLKDMKEIFSKPLKTETTLSGEVKISEASLEGVSDEHKELVSEALKKIVEARIRALTQTEEGPPTVDN